MMRHGKAWGPAALRRVRIPELHKVGEYLVADTVEALVSLAQMGVVEIHTWNAPAETPYLHDRIVVDLDPGEAVPWARVVAAAKLVRRSLEAVGLASFVKTTGGAGLHVVAPIASAPAAECLAFARGVASALVSHDPSLFTTSLPKRGREKKIFIDALRNNRTNTSVAALSLRARQGAPASLPLAWDELDDDLDPKRYGLRSVPDVLRAVPDPWRAYPEIRQTLPTLEAPLTKRRGTSRTRQ